MTLARVAAAWKRGRAKSIACVARVGRAGKILHGTIKKIADGEK
jgi:hypothetical protein